MDTRAIMWIIIGVILILGGITSSLREGKNHPPKPVPQVEAPVKSTFVEPSADKKFDTGFSIDPVKGLRRKDENQEYFK